MPLPTSRSARVWAIAFLISGIASPVRSQVAALRRVVMLPLADRTTIAAELSAAVPQVREISSHAAAVVIEFGPVDPATAHLDLTPVGRSPFVDHVSVRTAIASDGLTYVRLETALGAFGRHRLRVSGPRIYVDFAPVEERSGVRGAAAAPADVESAYRSLESSALRRAKVLAARPDVKELLRLHDEILGRDEQLGRQRPELVSGLVAEIVRLTNEARAAQLEKDRRDFLKTR